MNEREDINRGRALTADEQRALAALRAAPPVTASAAARARARAAFLGAGTDDAAPAITGSLHRRGLVVRYAMAAVITLALVGGGLWATQPRYLWHVTDVVAPEGIVTAAGELRPGAALHGGTIRTGGESEIELQLGEEFRFRLRPGGEVTIPDPPRRWFAREILLTVHQGHIFGTTGGPLDLPLRVVGREAEAEIRGTTFAVLLEPTFTCVCLWEGTVVATSRGPGATPPVQLPAGHKVMFYPDGSVSALLPLEAPEQMKLQMMKDGGILPVPGRAGR
jgi:ferric-dicitrate binding protein FerR (iron transport regulator)